MKVAELVKKAKQCIRDELDSKHSKTLERALRYLEEAEKELTVDNILKDIFKGNRIKMSSVADIIMKVLYYSGLPVGCSVCILEQIKFELMFHKYCRKPCKKENLVYM